MKPEDIIRMAREAGFTSGEIAWHDEMFERFADKCFRAGMEYQESVEVDLLEALKSCIEYGSMTGAEWVADKARAAIAKATGEQA